MSETAIPLVCRIGWHHWPKWSDPQPARVTQWSFDLETGVSHQSPRDTSVQIRRCPDCNKEQWRTR